MKTATFYINKPGEIKCQLCPQACLVKEGETGVCKVRKNIEGELYSENYGKITSMNFDPIEKKPLYHFYPGSIIFSIGTAGCNLNCDFCQNAEISQSGMADFPFLKNYTPEDTVKLALQNKSNIGLAYTYNEPSIWYEFVLDTCQIAKENMLLNVLVTNGYINKNPLKELLPLMDAFNVDLKAFTEDFYRKYTSSSLIPVLNAIKQIHESGKHLEITNLIIPGLNDDPVIFEQMVKWIAGETGKETPLHLSRYFPMNRMKITPTPEKTMLSLFEIAQKYLSFVYLGNITTPKGKNTFCPGCGHETIRRNGYFTEIRGLDKDGCCLNCLLKVAVRN